MLVLADRVADRVDQAEPRAEVLVERRPGHTGTIGDLLDGGRVERPVLEQLAHGLEDPSARRLRAAVRAGRVHDRKGSTACSPYAPPATRTEAPSYAPAWTRLRPDSCSRSRSDGVTAPIRGTAESSSVPTRTNWASRTSPSTARETGPARARKSTAEPSHSSAPDRRHHLRLVRRLAAALPPQSTPGSPAVRTNPRRSACSGDGGSTCGSLQAQDRLRPPLGRRRLLHSLHLVQDGRRSGRRR